MTNNKLGHNNNIYNNNNNNDDNNNKHNNNINSKIISFKSLRLTFIDHN